VNRSGRDRLLDEVVVLDERAPDRGQVVGVDTETSSTSAPSKGSVASNAHPLDADRTASET
jgi:hypothetical protein